MTDERTPDARTVAVLLAVAAGFLLFAPTATAQQATCTEGLENHTNLSDAAATPGGLLADAIGDQREVIGSELNDRWFDARLENATSTRERARIVADEVDRIESNVSTLERCWGINRTERDANRTLEDLSDDERASLTNYTRSLHQRLNETRTEADKLPRSVRGDYDLDDEGLTSLEERILAVRNATERAGPSASPGGRAPFPSR
jgi:hypothetical protein